MLKVVLYAYMNHIYSSHKIENPCRRDINFMYLLDGASAPDYSTIARSRSIHFAPVAEKIMVEMTNLLAYNEELSLEDLFVDGTKIEASANKYTFVWKKAVTKNQKKLMDKIPAFILQAENDFCINILCKNEVKIYHLKKLRKKLKKIQKEESIAFVHGAGKRKNLIQKTLEQLDHYLARLKKYNQHIHADEGRCYEKWLVETCL